jgi:hypothetical protein
MKLSFTKGFFPIGHKNSSTSKRCKRLIENTIPIWGQRKENALACYGFHFTISRRLIKTNEV